MQDGNSYVRRHILRRRHIHIANVSCKAAIQEDRRQYGPSSYASVVINFVREDTNFWGGNSVHHHCLKDMTTEIPEKNENLRGKLCASGFEGSSKEPAG